MNLYKIKRFYQNIKDFFNPKNNWAKKAIPNSFSDVDYIIETIILEALIDYWENDSGEETTRYQFECYHELDEPMDQERYDYRKQVYEDLKKAYEFAKNRKRLYKAAHVGSNWNRKEIENYEKQYKDAVETIFKHRHHLWT